MQRLIQTSAQKCCQLCPAVWPADDPHLREKVVNEPAGEPRAAVLFVNDIQPAIPDRMSTGLPLS